MTQHQAEDEELRRAWGKSLSAAMKARGGLSQRAVADLCGVEQPTISRIARGERFPSERMKRLLAGALRLSIPELFPYSPTPPPVPNIEEAA